MKKLTLIFSLLISLNSLAQMSWLDSSNNSSSDKKEIFKKYADLSLSNSDASIIQSLNFISPNQTKITPNMLWVSYNFNRGGSIGIPPNEGRVSNALLLEGYRTTSYSTVYTASNVFGNVANTQTSFNGAHYIVYLRKKQLIIRGGSNNEVFLIVNAKKKPSEKILRVILRKIKNGDY